VNFQVLRIVYIAVFNAQIKTNQRTGTGHDSSRDTSGNASTPHIFRPHRRLQERPVLGVSQQRDERHNCLWTRQALHIMGATEEARKDLR
jgi:hypothetical protein